MKKIVFCLMFVVMPIDASESAAKCEVRKSKRRSNSAGGFNSQWAVVNGTVINVSPPPNEASAKDKSVKGAPLQSSSVAQNNRVVHESRGRAMLLNKQRSMFILTTTPSAIGSESARHFGEARTSGRDPNKGNSSLKPDNFFNKMPGKEKLGLPDMTPPQNSTLPTARYIAVSAAGKAAKPVAPNGVHLTVATAFFRQHDEPSKSGSSTPRNNAMGALTARQTLSVQTQLPASPTAAATPSPISGAVGAASVSAQVQLVPKEQPKKPNWFLSCFAQCCK